MYVINPDRTWTEPWRFLTYGMVHNNGEHIALNVVCQLFFGLPLELSHSSWRVALVYLSGIVFGGFGRELLKPNSHIVMAGALGSHQLKVILQLSF